ncbi:MAG: tetratricopeptide repeat protein, partial [Candidatus Hodarchaeota archaeon]
MVNTEAVLHPVTEYGMGRNLFLIPFIKNNLELAIKYFQKAIELNPKFKEKALKDSDFDNIKKTNL